MLSIQTKPEWHKVLPRVNARGNGPSEGYDELDAVERHQRSLIDFLKLGEDRDRGFYEIKYERSELAIIYDRLSEFSSSGDALATNVAVYYKLNVGRNPNYPRRCKFGPCGAGIAYVNLIGVVVKIFEVSLFCLVFVSLSGCDQLASGVDHKELGITPIEMKHFIEEVKRDLVFVEGGEYLMGDYGLQYGPEQMSYDSDEDSRPVHKVKLSTFSIARFKISNKEFEMYLKSNGLNLRSFENEEIQEEWKNIHSLPNLPAHMDWYEADRYCNWLAKVSNLPFSLPTEAQWEYAARSRGQFLMVATDDGTYRQTNDGFTKYGGGPKGINISTSRDRRDFARQMGWSTDGLTPLPVDRFPPNPLGLYAMSDNGLEWVKDWYDENYYQYSPEIDPQGPETPVSKDYYSRDTKVLRGQAYANPSWGGGVNVHRTPKNPHGYASEHKMIVLGDKTARCVVNSDSRIE